MPLRDRHIPSREAQSEHNRKRTICPSNILLPIMSFQQSFTEVLVEKRDEAVEGDLVHLVVEIRMRSTQRNDNLLLRTICRCIDRIREVLRMRLVSCDEQQRAWAEFLDVLHQREVEEAVRRRRIPGQRVGVDGARMVSAADVIIVEALHDIRCIRPGRLSGNMVFIEITLPSLSTASSCEPGMDLPVFASSSRISARWCLTISRCSGV